MPDRLKLNVFTPLPPSPTDIANVNLPIITLLQDAADVTVWTPQEYWDPLEDKRIEVKTFRADAIAFWDLNDADANIFHIGNNREMHEDIFDIARRIPGLIVLHDVNLHEFSLEMYHAKRIATYEEILRRCHGERALNEARHALAHGGMDAVLRRYPCSLAPAAHATGILMHNAKAAADLRRQTTIPVFDLPLPFADLVWPQPRRHAATRRPYRLIVFGYLGSNRRLDIILKVLADSPVRHLFTLDIYGMAADPEALDARIDKLSLDDIVRTHGFVPFDELNAAIADGDLVLNLRNPTVGEASGSQLRIWANGAASVVTGHGWYDDLPDDCAHKIDPDDEVDDLGHLLIDFCCRPAHYRAMGDAGRRHVMSAHDPRTYVSELLAILRQEPARRRDALARGLAMHLSTDRDRRGGLTERAVSAVFGDVIARRVLTQLSSADADLADASAP